MSRSAAGPVTVIPDGLVAMTVAVAAAASSVGVGGMGVGLGGSAVAVGGAAVSVGITGVAVGAGSVQPARDKTSANPRRAVAVALVDLFTVVSPFQGLLFACTTKYIRAGGLWKKGRGGGMRNAG